MNHWRKILLSLCLTISVKPLSACRNASQELQAIVNADQKDRSKSDLTAKEWAKVEKRDLKRRKRVAEIFAEGCFKTGMDYYSAALVFQHGEAPDHFYQAYIWATRAIELGVETDLAAVALDRYLEYKGYKQLYGSQFRRIRDNPNHCSCVWPVEESVTDDDRRRMHAHPLAEKLQWVDKINAGKSCPPASYCQEDAKPVPKGSLPGVPW